VSIPSARAGKTTLLNTLAGQLPQNPLLTLSGFITVNGVPVDRSAHGQGYVQQEDIFYSQLTVKCADPSPCGVQSTCAPSLWGSQCASSQVCNSLRSIAFACWGH
jgi:ABC-type Mn2+/Zn2+ transport system ATPase subunit